MNSTSEMPQESLPNSQPKATGGILDAITQAEQNAFLRNLSPLEAINEFLQVLAPREQQVIKSRFGLETGRVLTLEVIGQQMGLTRERIRQIEKDATRKLANTSLPENFARICDLIFQIIENRGCAARQSELLSMLLPAQTNPNAKSGILFVLNMNSRFNQLRETPNYHTSWYITGFDNELLDEVITRAEESLRGFGKSLKPEEIFSRVREGSREEIRNLSDEILESYLAISKKLDKNPFDEWGLASWTEIHPKDVGDKAYLVLLHYGEPEHYLKITEMINKQKFDNRIAHKESVHNELIKDQRFVLVGRGIYALREWGYKKGVVSDIIREILAKAQEPLSKEEIIAAVLKQRVVKKNTIIVGLSNKKLFRKAEDNKYQNAQ